MAARISTLVRDGWANEGVAAAYSRPAFRRIVPSTSRPTQVTLSVQVGTCSLERAGWNVQAGKS